MPFKQPHGAGGNSDTECDGLNKKKGMGSTCFPLFLPLDFFHDLVVGKFINVLR
jgi:hypothetical protein